MLKDVGVFTNSDVDDICRSLEGGIGRLNGLISRMEDDGDAGS